MADAVVELKPGTDRPMSTTADATHFMHHSGSIEMTRVSMQGQGYALPWKLNLCARDRRHFHLVAIETVWCRGPPDDVLVNQFFFVQSRGWYPVHQTILVSRNEQEYNSFVENVLPGSSHCLTCGCLYVRDCRLLQYMGDRDFTTRCLIVSINRMFDLLIGVNVLFIF